MEKRTFDDIYDLSDLMYNHAVNGKTIYAALFYEEASALIRGLLEYDEVSVRCIDIAEERCGGYNKEYYVILNGDLTLWAEKAWHDKTEFNKASYLYFEADELFIDGAASYAIVKEQGNPSCVTTEVDFNSSTEHYDMDDEEDNDFDDDYYHYDGPVLSVIDALCDIINTLYSDPNGNQDDDILEFINRRFPKDSNWNCENCYYFSLILKDRFPGGKICYDVIDGHFSYCYKGNYYDHTGLIHPDGYIVDWDQFDEYDSIQKQRIIRDCIM